MHQSAPLSSTIMSVSMGYLDRRSRKSSTRSSSRSLAIYSDLRRHQWRLFCSLLIFRLSTMTLNAVLRKLAIACWFIGATSFIAFRASHILSVIFFGRPAVSAGASMLPYRTILDRPLCTVFVEHDLLVYDLRLAGRLLLRGAKGAILYVDSPKPSMVDLRRKTTWNISLSDLRVE